MKNFNQHAHNIFKLLALIIIASELGVLRFLLCPSTLLAEARIIQQMPTIFEYFSVSIAIYIIGYILWLAFEKRLVKNT